MCFRCVIQYGYIKIILFNHPRHATATAAAGRVITIGPTAAIIVAMEQRPATGITLSVSIVLHHSPLGMLDGVLRSLLRSAEVAHAAQCLDRVVVEVLDNSSEETFRKSACAAIGGFSHSDFFRITYRGLPENRGFGAAHNLAIQHLDSEFHLVLNPDAELAEDALRIGLCSLQADPGIVLLSPQARGANGAQEFLCKRYPSFLVLLLRPFAPRLIRRIFRKRLDHYEMRDVCADGKEVDILLASGCFMLARTAALQSVGGFNDDYFMYFEDFDLSIRLGKQGRLVFNPAIQIVHHGGYAAKKGRQHINYFIRSGITFFREHGWRWI